MPGCEVMPVKSCMYEHPARSVEVSWRGENSGPHSGIASVAGRDRSRRRPGCRLAEAPPPERRAEEIHAAATLSLYGLRPFRGYRLRELAGVLRNRIQAAAGVCCESVEYLYSYRGQLPSRRTSRADLPRHALCVRPDAFERRGQRCPLSAHRRAARRWLRTSRLILRQAGRLQCQSRRGELWIDANHHLGRPLWERDWPQRHRHGRCQSVRTRTASNSPSSLWAALSFAKWNKTRPTAA